MKTKSEQLFEQFCEMNAVVCDRIPANDDKTPDYVITLCGTRMVVEIKELTPNNDDQKVIQESEVALPGECVSWGGTLGKRVRHKIESAKHQLKNLAAGKCPGILLLYDARPYPFQGLHSLNDYEIGVAMYGFETIDLHVSTDHAEPVRFGSHRFGKGRKVGRDYHSYISAVGVLREPNAQKIHVDLYLNVYADQAYPLPVRGIMTQKNFTVYTLPSVRGNVFREWARLVTDEEYRQATQTSDVSSVSAHGTSDSLNQD